jgi:hypothetical protein
VKFENHANSGNEKPKENAQAQKIQKTLELEKQRKRGKLSGSKVESTETAYRMEGVTFGLADRIICFSGLNRRRRRAGAVIYFFVRDSLKHLLVEHTIRIF